MHSYNNVAQLRHFRGVYHGIPRPNGAKITEFHLESVERRSSPASRLSPRSVDLNIQIADFLPQGIAIEAQKVGGPDLVATGCGQRSRQ
jgi:hypothetical protein